MLPFNNEIPNFNDEKIIKSLNRDKKILTFISKHIQRKIIKDFSFK